MRVANNIQAREKLLHSLLEKKNADSCKLLIYNEKKVSSARNNDFISVLGGKKSPSVDLATLHTVVTSS